MRDARPRNTVTLWPVLAAVLACACTVGPNYSRPPATVPDDFRGLPPDDLHRAGNAESASLGDQKWWEVFEDETLQGLIGTALEQNYDVRIAASRILQARARLGITRADQLPAVSAGAATANQRIPRSLAAPAVDTNFNQVSVSAEWELDFWGKF